jgi:nickel-dependent lactate racemase
MVDKFGRCIADNETIINHDCTDNSSLVYKGILPSGGELYLNSLIDWADIVISEGFIEPHFFAGFSGGRKSILPGIAGKRTIFANHCSEFIADKNARTGILEENPIHKDMLFAAGKANLAFILNVVIDSKKRIINAFAGDPIKAHEKGCAFLQNIAEKKAVKSDIVITSNGGYPLDQNIYQAVKGMTAAEVCVNPGGVIIMVAACNEGHGGESFYRWFAESSSPKETLDKINSIPRDKTVADQWEAQILARILIKHKVIMVSDIQSKKLIEDMHMIYSASVEEALDKARQQTNADAGIVVIPDGVGIIIRDY